MQTGQQAAAALAQLEGIRLTGLSGWFETTPVPPSDQPNYINAVALLRVLPGFAIDSELLLARLMTLEASFGRRRSVPNAARTLDLDMIAAEGPDGPVVRETPDPILPHPRAHLRAFVLAPLAQVAPWWVHPVLKRTASSLLAELPQDGIRPL